jgi:hypothetical protein
MRPYFCDQSLHGIVSSKSQYIRSPREIIKAAPPSEYISAPAPTPDQPPPDDEAPPPVSMDLISATPNQADNGGAGGGVPAAWGSYVQGTANDYGGGSELLRPPSSPFLLSLMPDPILPSLALIICLSQAVFVRSYGGKD